MIGKEKAQEYYENGEYEQALIIYEKNWISSNKDDANLFFKYGRTLKKCNKPIVYIDSYNNLSQDSNLRKNPYVLSILCWCIYDAYIKNYKNDDFTNFEEFIKYSEFIIENTEQKAYATPFILTIIKVVKVYKSKSSSKFSKKCQEEIITWLKRLDPSTLSEECKIAKVGEDEYELASHKEFYYQHLVNAYEKTEKYDECIACGEKALSEIKRFHYHNKVWIRGRVLYSKCMISTNREIDFQEYKMFAEKEKYWFLWYKLANLCYSYGMFKDSLLYSCKAICNEKIDEKKVNLLYNLGLCWDSQGRQDISKKYYQACVYYRNLMGWNLSEELQYYISIYDLDISKKPNIDELKNISKEYIDKNDNEYLYGQIKIILKSGKEGFIVSDIDKSKIYFNVYNIVDSNKRIYKGKTVKYKKVINDKGKFEAISVEGVKK